MAILETDPALTAYESLAPFYDAYTEGYDHERWLLNLEAIALEHGLSGKSLLDVGCGTGKSFVPLLRRGYDVVACDLSPAMVSLARERADGMAHVVVADARHLPALGCFDLVTCLDDAFNYLISDDELGAAFESVARNLRPGGMLVFDLNSLATYRGFFAQDAVVEVDGALFCWRGAGDPGVGPGALCSSTIEIFSTDDGDCYRRRRSTHVQRHHPPELVTRLLGEAGLELVERRGQVTGARVEPDGDEDRHVKLVYFARRRGR
jgi:SAM-dependent methyltransferase